MSHPLAIPKLFTNLRYQGLETWKKHNNRACNMAIIPKASSRNHLVTFHTVLSLLTADLEETR